MILAAKDIVIGESFMRAREGENFCFRILGPDFAQTVTHQGVESICAVNIKDPLEVTIIPADEVVCTERFGE